MAEILNLALCFQYESPANGDTVVRALISDYVSLIGKKVCDIVSQLTTNQNILLSLAERVTNLESATPEQYTLPSLSPTGIGNPNVPLALDVFTAELEKQFVLLRGALGTTTDIYDTITMQPAGFNQALALGTTGGTMGALSGWVLNTKTLSDSVNNAWLTLLDLRSGVRNLQLAFPTSCDGVAVALQTSYVAKVLTLYFTGTIPNDLIACEPTGALFKVEDKSGNFVNTSVKIKENLNIVGGYAVDLSASSLNFADDLKVSSVFCVYNQITGTTCQKYIEANVSNTSACPSLSLSSGVSSVSYQFVHVSGALTYYIELFTITGILVETKSISVSAAQSIAGSFTGLSSNTPYKVRTQMVTSETTRACPFVSTSTITNPCAAPDGVTMAISY